LQGQLHLRFTTNQQTSPNIHMNIIFPLSLLAAYFMAQAAQTPPK
jgi:hypothetical protein